MATSPVMLIFMLVLSTAAFGTLLTLSVIQNGIPNNGIYNQTPGAIASKYPTDLDPATYAFSIWFLIFLMQFGWIGYAFSTACRTNSKGLVIANPVVLPKKFHFAWILSCGSIILWSFLFDRDQLLGSALALFVGTVLGFAALVFNLTLTSLYERKMQTDMYADLVCIRVFVQNGIDMFFSWCTFATLISICTALAYDPNAPVGFSQQDASSICLYTLGIIIVFWSVLENTKLFRLVRYVYSWYFVLIWALSAIIVEHPDTSQKNTIITIVLLCISVVCLVAKITVFALTPSANFKKAKKYKLLDEE